VHKTQTDVEVPAKAKSNETEEVELQLTAKCPEDIEVAKKRIEDLIKRQETEAANKARAEKEPSKDFKQKKEVKKSSFTTKI